MAAIPAPEQADSPADPAGLLAAVRAERVVADRAEARILALAADWAAMHEWSDPLDPQQLITLAGPGTPHVGEYCVAELAAALRISTDAGRSLLAEAVELAHRLPRTWARVTAGDLPAWRARRVAASTISLSAAGASFVDRQVAPFAHRVGPAALDRLVEEALVRFDPDTARARRAAAADARHVTIHTQQVGYDGTVHLDADLDLADALDLDTALTAAAAQLAACGSTDPLDARRAHALGELARGTDPTLDLAPAGTPRRREVVLHVHLTPDALTGDQDELHLARVENTRSFVDADQVRTWCGTPGTTITVRPVLDLAEHLSATGYETPDRLAEQATHVDDTCAFPWCTRSARRADCDHVQPHAAGGTTCSCNIARLCRRHHRLKTHTAWRYTVLERGSYLWTSPHGYQFHRDRTGTHDVTPTTGPGTTTRPGTVSATRHLLLLPDP